MRVFAAVSAAVVLLSPALGCDDCYGPNAGQHMRNVRRMQPDAQNASYGPKEPLAWGQINFLHTTDSKMKERFAEPLSTGANLLSPWLARRTLERAELWGRLGRLC